MFALGDLTLGVLLGVSALLLVLAMTGYRRGGVKALLTMSFVLVFHLAYTFSVILAIHVTDWLDLVDALVLLGISAAILLLAIVVGLLGGRRAARPS